MAELTHETHKGKEAIAKLCEQIKADTAAGRELMDSGVLNESIYGYIQAALNDSESLTTEQRKEVMRMTRHALESLTAAEAANYYNTAKIQ